MVGQLLAVVPLSFNPPCEPYPVFRIAGEGNPPVM